MSKFQFEEYITISGLATPAYVSEQSIAYDVANKDFSTINEPLMPERQQWLNNYANTEWTVDEIAQGLPFSRLTF